MRVEATPRVFVLVVRSIWILAAWSACAEEERAGRARGLESWDRGDEVVEDERADGDVEDGECRDGGLGYGVDFACEEGPEPSSRQDAERHPDDGPRADGEAGGAPAVLVTSRAGLRGGFHLG